jgi:predicted ATPase
MLKRLKVEGFKSLQNVRLEFPPLTVLFGPNTAGKSNLLDALVILSRTATQRTLADAFSGEGVRGHPLEMFQFPQGGLSELIEKEKARIAFEVDLETKARDKTSDRVRYKVAIDIDPRPAALSIADEYLAPMTKNWTPRYTPVLELRGGQIHIRRKSKPAHPRIEPLGLNHTQLSDARFAGKEYFWIEKTRKQLSGFRTYYLDPRVSMRRSVPPREVEDIGTLGEDIAPFLYRLTDPKFIKHFQAIERTLKTIIPSVDSLSVDLDEKRGTLDLQITQNGTPYNCRIISEGTLRVLALCCVAASPWPGELIAFEEPENGVHPRRLELVAQMIADMAIDRARQVIVTSHSPLFCEKILSMKREYSKEISLIVVRQEKGKTYCRPFETSGELFKQKEIMAALSSPEEDGWFENLVLRGIVDA